MTIEASSNFTMLIQTQFHHFYDRTGPHPRPAVTVCQIFDGRRYGYGWAIVGPRDRPCKRTGRAIALQRAQAALEGHGTQGAVPLAWFYDRPIRRAEALVALGRCGLSPATLMASLPAPMYASVRFVGLCRHCGLPNMEPLHLNGLCRGSRHAGHRFEPCGSEEKPSADNPFLALDDVAQGEEVEGADAAGLCSYCGQPESAHDPLAGGLLCPRIAGGDGTTYTPENPFLALDDAVLGREVQAMDIGTAVRIIDPASTYHGRTGVITSFLSPGAITMCLTPGDDGPTLPCLLEEVEMVCQQDEEGHA